MWTEISLNRADWLTSIKLSHTDPEHPSYKDLGPEGYISFTHEVKTPERTDTQS